MNHPQSSDTSSEGSQIKGDVEKNPGRLLSMGKGKVFPPLLPNREDYVVGFDGPDDPEHPFSWAISIKLYVSIMVCFGTFTASFASAVFAPGAGGAAKAFGVSSEVGMLGTTLYVLGFASGPLIWAPASELIGRRWPLTMGIVGVGLFSIASAVAKDIQTVIICRFFAGMFGASQLSVVPAVLSDIYNNMHRGAAIAVYSLTVFVGPFSGPFVGGFLASSSLGWRWTLYIPAFMGFACAAMFVLFLKETYAPCILVSKAAALRRQTSNWGIHAKQEEVEVDLQELVQKNFTRPLRMLVTEPIILVISVYMSFIYGLVYALLEAYPYVFESVYGMSPGVGGLTFCGLIIGQLLACGFILSQHSVYVKKLAANDNIPIPEWRLTPAIVGAPVFTAGIFWFSWTGFTPSIHWLAPTAAVVLIGFGILCIFLPCFNYLVDSYLPLAASTVAANIILRSSVAAGFPLFAKQMFANLGVQWAGTLLGCLAAIMIPIPLLFRLYGPRWGYDCHYSRHTRPRPSTPSHPDSDPVPVPDDSPAAAARVAESLEANSGAAFVRKVALKVDPVNAPKLNLFGWNVGKRKSLAPGASADKPIDDICSATTLQTLGRRYFAKIDPCYGFIDSVQFFRRMDARWQPFAEESTYDGVLAGVAALGALFSDTEMDRVESSLVELARHISDTHLGSAPPSLDLLTVWTLRVVYLRMAAPPYPAWVASSTLMHLIEASKLHQVSSDERDLDIRRRLIGVAQHLNIWISYDLGLSRVSLSTDTLGLPTPRPGDFTVELLGLLPLTASLGPENQRHDQEIEQLLLQTLDRTHTIPPSLLAQCNLTFCLLRRLRLTNVTTTPTTMKRVIDLLKRSLAAARDMATNHSPWQHVANVPFHMISILLEMDTSAALELLPDAMQTLKLVASTYDTDTMREAYSTAYLFINLYEKRRIADTRLLTRPPSGLNEISWVEGVMADVPTLQGLDFEQFLQPDMLRLSPDNLCNLINPSPLITKHPKPYQHNQPLQPPYPTPQPDNQKPPPTAPPPPYDYTPNSTP
ncbi:bicyclomycin resistance protein [Aspergillus sclerotioniger CBS 115572]|uniref:Bicyclomycin resistance protein n=1 Tax=Aspergillus sclerotioniger CBS 115572 TaxID=1450535 RepID=A0A317WZ17_9EURO|nr:bicyclomycin resistance protein [Aspergillus sclerotioniger CBS 115572]PWY91634.1 bicyclomycin resistance protein [Aspergillus sclerotioniger CBS 115572]